MDGPSRSSLALIAAALLVALPLAWNAYETRQLRLATTGHTSAATATQHPPDRATAKPKAVVDVVAYDRFHELFKPVAPRAEVGCYARLLAKHPTAALDELTHYRLKVAADGRILEARPEMDQHTTPENRELRRCIARLIQTHVRWPAPGKVISGRVQANRRY